MPLKHVFVAIVLLSGVAVPFAVGAQPPGSIEGPIDHPRPVKSPRPKPSPCTVPTLPGLPAGMPPEYASVTPPPGVPLAPPPGSYPTSGDAAGAIAAGTADAQAQGLYDPTVPGAGPSCEPPPSTCKKSSPGGSLLECIWDAARSFRNQSTAWPGTQCNDGDGDHLGNCACAASVQHIIYLATGAMIGNYGVDSFDAMFFHGEYGARMVPPAGAHRGAIVVFSATTGVGGGTHIGICAQNGCALTWSNSSSMAVFAPEDLPLYYFHPYVRIYEPTHIP